MIAKAPRHRQLGTRATLVTLVLLMLAQSTYWAGNSKWLSHALDHDGAEAAALLEGHHHVLQGETVPASEESKDVEHSLLHGMEHVQFMSASIAPHRLPFEGLLPALTVFVCFVLRRPERTFRPPRAPL